MRWLTVELLRYLPRLLQRAFGACHGNCFESPSAQELFHCHETFQFRSGTWSREASLAMYRNSMKELQVDYIDYMLLHGVGWETV